MLQRPLRRLVRRALGAVVADDGDRLLISRRIAQDSPLSRYLANGRFVTAASYYETFLPKFLVVRHLPAVILLIALELRVAAAAYGTIFAGDG